MLKKRLKKLNLNKGNLKVKSLKVTNPNKKRSPSRSSNHNPKKLLRLQLPTSHRWIFALVKLSRSGNTLNPRSSTAKRLIWEMVRSARSHPDFRPSFLSRECRTLWLLFWPI